MPQKHPVAAMNHALKNSPIAGPTEQESTVMLDVAKTTCLWNGETFNEGDLVENAGVVYECTYGKWVKRRE